jgi:ABC-2 type transport system permease protein
MYTLYKKELASFFSSLTGYLTIAVFLILTGLMLWVFKGYLNIIDFGYAGIDGLFAIGPYLYLFLIPAITMKLIAEERRGGTLETLMTHPLSDWTIVWAKFLAAWTLVLISLLPTLVYYFSVYSLGYPYPGNIDTGGVIGSYLGLLLLGGAFVSIGLFCSSLTKNQIVSFLAAAALCYIFYLGFDSLYDLGLFSGNTNLEVKRLGLSAHYDSISRGVVNTRDVVYFVGVIAIFVTLTRMVLQSRMWSGWSLRGKEKNRRRNLKMSHLLELCVVLIAVVSANVASHYLYTRFDLTAEKRYSLSDETKTYLKNIDETLLVRVYLDGEMSSDYKRLHDETREMLNLFRSYNENITFEFVDPNDEKEFSNEERQVVYQKMMQKGVYPVQEQLKEGNSVHTLTLLPGAELSYKGRSTAISLVQNQQYISEQGDIINNSIQNLEYALIRAIRNLSRVQKPTVAFLQGHGELSGAAIFNIAEAMEEFYNLDYVTIDGQIQALTNHMQNSKDSSFRFVNKYDLLIVAKPTQPFSDQDLFIIDQYIMYGGKVIWFIDAMNAEMDSLANRGQAMATRYPLGRLDEMLFNYGVRINSDILLDIVSQLIPMPVELVGNKPRYEFRPWFYYPELVPRSNHPIVKNLDLIKAEFISSIDTIQNNIKKTVLLTTSEFTRTKSAPAMIDVTDAMVQPDRRLYNRSLVPVAVLLEGEFRSAWRNRLAPEFVMEKSMGYRDHSEPTKMIVVSDGDIIRNQFNPNEGTIYPVGYDFYRKIRYANRELILNMLNYMTGDEGLMTVRNKNFTLRKLDADKAENRRTFYQIVNIVVPVLILALAGVCIILIEKRVYGKKALATKGQKNAKKQKNTKK